MTGPLLGVLGGMGPEAAVYFYQQILKNTPVTCDQDHIPTLTYQATFLPDRVQMIQEKRGAEFLDQLKVVLTLLYKANVSALAVPCNTVHYYLNQIRDEIPVPFFHLIESCLDDLEVEGVKKFCLLSTQGTIDTHLYHDGALRKGMQVRVPSMQDQRLVSQSIKAIKGGEKASLFLPDFLSLIHRLSQEGVNCFVLGCTELPLIFRGKPLDQVIPSLKIVDPMHALAKKVIAFYKG